MHVFGPIAAVFLVGLFESFNYSRNKKFLSQFMALPIIFCVSIFGILQYGVGTDYFNYLAAFDEKKFHIFTRNFEYISAFYLFIIHELGGNGQHYIAFYAVLQASLLHIIFSNLSSTHVRYSGLFLLFILITGMYFNQYNQLRQFTAFYITVIALIYLFKSHYLTSMFLMIFGALNHASSMVFIVFFLTSILLYQRVSSFSALLLGLILTFVIGFLFRDLLTLFFPVYSYYLHFDSENINLLALVSKFYYLPFIILSLIISNNKQKDKVSQYTDPFKFFLFCSYLSFFSFMIPFVAEFSFFSRITANLTFLYIFPVYIVMKHLFRRRLIIGWVVASLYLSLPLVTKLIIFPVREYDYNWIL